MTCASTGGALLCAGCGHGLDFHHVEACCACHYRGCHCDSFTPAHDEGPGA